MSVHEKFEFYKRAEKNKKGSGSYFRDDCHEFLQGNMGEKKKKNFYPCWTKKDFEKLLELINNHE